MKYNMILFIYVDNKILSCPYKKAYEGEIKSLGVRSDEQRHYFGLRDKGEVGDFCGIIMDKTR